MKLKSGFVLIELMVVVAIIGILAAVALPSYQDYLLRAKISEALVMASEVKSSVNEFYLATGKMPENNEAAGLAIDSAYRGSYVLGILVENGAIHISFDSNEFGSDQAEPSITLLPLSNDDVITLGLAWACNSTKEIEGLTLHGENRTNMNERYLPQDCRG
jgi:type IV pilus assembly protein PilA